MYSRRRNPTRKLSPTLDFTSELFDPVRVLSSRRICLPFPKAKTYNNIAEYHTHTFLKMKEEPKQKEIPIERNYPWFIHTLGFSGESAAIFERRLKSNRDRNKRRGKKPISITYTPCAPLRSGKVIKLKSNYKAYWRRKRILFKQANRSDVESSVSLFQKIKYLAKPLSALELIRKAKENCSTQAVLGTEAKLSDSNDNSDEKTSEGISVSAVPDVCQDANLPNTYKEQNAQESDSNCRSIPCTSSTNESCNKIKRSSKVKKLGKSKERFLAVKSKTGHKSRNKKKSVQDKCSNLLQVQNGLDKIVAKNRKRRRSKIVLTPKENDSSLLTKKSCASQDLVNFDPKISNEEKISQRPMPPVPFKSRKSDKTTMKENVSLLIKHCTCFPSVSGELSSQCSCGVYLSAMKNLQKFKIPRKKYKS